MGENMNYNIEKKTPASRWYTIHRGYDRDTAVEFLKEMANGGFDQSAEQGDFNEDDLTAHYYDGGDRVEFRAVASGV